MEQRWEALQNWTADTSGHTQLELWKNSTNEAVTWGRMLLLGSVPVSSSATEEESV